MRTYSGYLALVVLAMVLTHMHGTFAVRARSSQANRKRSGESSLLCSGSFPLFAFLLFRFRCLFAFSSSFIRDLYHLRHVRACYVSFV